jgi:hypothetical protein
VLKNGLPMRLITFLQCKAVVHLTTAPGKPTNLLIVAK